jgi:ubiquinone/menaquinone biosynthesis C-methylase UbiE
MAMAGMEGASGRVVAVDLQEEMLDRVRRRAAGLGFQDRIRLHACTQEAIGLDTAEKADFVLAFYMVHETLDHGNFLDQVREILKPGGLFLVKEPRFHVSGDRFRAMVETACARGFTLLASPGSIGDRGALFTA